MLLGVNNPKQKQINMGYKDEAKERPRYSIVIDKKKRLMGELINITSEDISKRFWVAQKYI